MYSPDNIPRFHNNFVAMLLQIIQVGAAPRRSNLLAQRAKLMLKLIKSFQFWSHPRTIALRHRQHSPI
jgi:hypothetical protein